MSRSRFLIFAVYSILAGVVVALASVAVSYSLAHDLISDAYLLAMLGEFIASIVVFIVTIILVLSKKYRLSSFLGLYLSARVGTIFLPFDWPAVIDQIRFVDFATEDRLAIETMRRSKQVLDPTIIMVPWGESGFAGMNFFAYLAHSNKSVELTACDLLNDDNLPVVISSRTRKTWRLHFSKEECITSITRISGGYYAVRAQC